MGVKINQTLTFRNDSALTDHHFILLWTRIASLTEIQNDPGVYTSSFFLLFGSSNLMDIEDIDEDRKENIETIAVVYGKKISQYISYLSLSISMVLILEKILELYKGEIISHILIT